MPETVPQRQRALIDIAEQGVRNLGKGIAVRELKPSTVDYLAALQADHIQRFERGGADVSFTHDIFFEWSFFRLLIELGSNWPTALSAAGEPPLLGRVVGLLAQDALTETGRWIAGYAKLEGSSLRAQWRREWLTAPPFTHAFESAVDEFTQLVEANDFALCEQLLVWFQAQHTVPSPIILKRAVRLVEGMDPVRLADLLGWPSDGVAWGRLIDWMVARGAAPPPGSCRRPLKCSASGRRRPCGPQERPLEEFPGGLQHVADRPRNRNLCRRVSAHAWKVGRSWQRSAEELGNGASQPSPSFGSWIP